MSGLQKKPTQCEKVLDYLRKHESLDFMKAWNELGISQVGARIFEIEHDYNIPIKRTQAKFKAKDGTTVNYVKYSIY